MLHSLHYYPIFTDKDTEPSKEKRSPEIVPHRPSCDGTESHKTEVPLPFVKSLTLD